MSRLMARLTIVFVSFVLLSSPPATADLQRAVSAYKAFALTYSNLPIGQCTSPSLTPYIRALEQLSRFEALAENIDDAPDLAEQRYYLEDIINTREACYDSMAGISFRCDGPCPPSEPSFKYKEIVELPRVNFGSSNSVVVNCIAASKPRQLTTPMQRNGVNYAAHCFYLANGRESCSDACRRMVPNGTCDQNGLALAAQSVDQCKAVVATLGGATGLDHSRSGQYGDNNAGCTYGDWGTADKRWVQVMLRGGDGPTCNAIDGDSSRMRVCACK